MANLIDIPGELLKEFGIAATRPVKQPDGEIVWHSYCPFENQGHDRFAVWSRGNFFCNKCGAKGWLGSVQRSPEEIAKWRETIRAEEELQRKKQLDAVSRWKQAGHERDVALWHSQNHKPYWRNEGVPEWFVEQYQCGYVDSKPVQVDGERGKEIIHLPAYVIPIWTPQGELVNIQYRLENPPEGVGKYRQEPNIPASALFMNEDMEHEAIFVEGAKKCAVVYDFIGRKMQVVGFPSNQPAETLLRDQCAKFKKIYLIWDPGSDRQVLRMGKLMPGKIWALTLPAKPDDAIVKYGMTLECFRQYFRYAEQVK